MRGWCSAVVWLASLAVVVAAGAQTVEVTERAGGRQAAWLVTAGVPFPRGSLAADAALVVRDGRGETRPAQVRTLLRWDDGSVRWVLVHFPADLEPGTRATYALARGRAGAPDGDAPAVHVRDAGDRIEVDTGRLGFAIRKDRFAVLDDLRLRGAAVGLGPLEAELSLGEAGAALPPEEVKIHERGPLRVSVEVRGRHESGVAYSLVVMASAGASWVRILHTFINVTDARVATLRRASLTLPHRLDAPLRSTCGADGRPRAGEVGPGEIVALQTGESDATVAGSRARRADGWCQLVGARVAVTLAGRWFWQEYPKAIRVGPRALAYDLWPATVPGGRLGTGVAKTHELFVAVDPAAAAAEAIGRTRVLQRPPVAVASPRWIRDSGALPNAIDPDLPQSRRFLARLAQAVAGYEKRVATEAWDDRGLQACPPDDAGRRIGFYGMFNWGDWNFPGFHDHTEGCDGWGNLEYDLPQVLALGLAASGDPRYAELLEPAARHYRDVDVIHHLREHPDWVGMNHPHKALHVSFDSPRTIDLGHTWTEGLISHYVLTGEGRSLEAARGIADAVERRLEKAGNPRQYGWPLIALAGVYTATRDARDLEAVRLLSRRAIAAHVPDPTRINWKLGVLADGLAYAHALTGDPAIKDWLLGYAKSLLAAPASFDLRYVAPFGYLSRVTDDSTYLAEAQARIEACELSSWGKPLAANARVAFRVLSFATTPAPAPSARPALRPATPARRRAPGAGPRSSGSPRATGAGRENTRP